MNQEPLSDEGYPICKQVVDVVYGTVIDVVPTDLALRRAAVFS